MHFLKEIPVHEMQKLRKEDEKKEEWKSKEEESRDHREGCSSFSTQLRDSPYILAV